METPPKIQDEMTPEPIDPQLPPVPNPVAPPVAPSPSRFNRIAILMGQIGMFYRANKYYVWAIALGLIILLTLAFFAFRPQEAQRKPAKVDIAIDAPETMASGGEQVYKFKITNNDSVELVDLGLELIYPSGATYLDSTPKASNLSGTVFPVPNLAPGQNVAILVKTIIQGQINDEKKVVAKLHYSYSNFNSDFVAESNHTVRLVAADVALELSGSLSTNNAQIVSYEISYKNNSDKDITNSRIEVKYPDQFKFANSEPEPNLAKNIWNVGTLQSGQEGKITFQGSFEGANSGQSQTFEASFLVLDNAGSYFTQATSSFTTAIVSLPLLVTQSVTSGAQNNIVKPGDVLNYKITYSNTASIPARGASVVLTIDSPAIDLSSIRAEGAQVSNNTVTWNASSDSDLETLNPNESGNLNLSITVKNPAVRDNTQNVEVKTTVKIKSDEYDTFLPGNDLAIKVATVANLETTLEHVSGPLPPKVGQATVYKITLALRNSTNEIRDGILTGFIPLGAGGFDSNSIQPSSDKVNTTFDSSSGKLTWKISKLLAHSGNFNPLRKLSFNVRLIPSSSQSGKEVILMKTILYKATDSFTSRPVSLTAEDITTTDLSNNGFNNGIVE